MLAEVGDGVTEPDNGEIQFDGARPRTEAPTRVKKTGARSGIPEAVPISKLAKLLSGSAREPQRRAAIDRAARFLPRIVSVVPRTLPKARVAFDYRVEPAL
ncbi:hypothetical protein R1flu_018435 [Riccia fluitans]|uniref:Uncharacterized protein n=1 Tax=Riccia fluitans TaxID=41844 RepID=A0ABD1ZG11_9MARC